MTDRNFHVVVFAHCNLNLPVPKREVVVTKSWNTVKRCLHLSSFPVWKTGDVANWYWKTGKLRMGRRKRNFVTLSSFQFSSSVFSTGKCERVFHAHEPEVVLWFSSLEFQIIRFCVIKTLIRLITFSFSIFPHFILESQTDIDIAIQKTEKQLLWINLQHAWCQKSTTNCFGANRHGEVTATN